jgi:hypothetical protein
MINMAEVGAFPAVTPGGFQIRFGLYLPGIRAQDGFEVLVRLIHKEDRFDPAVQPQDSSLAWTAGHALDLWTATVPVQPVAGTHFGTAGLYLYRFQLWWTPPGGTRQLLTRWFTDPFARQTEIGRLSAVLLAPTSAPFAWTDAGYKTPDLDDLIVYELHVEQFNDTFDGIIGLRQRQQHAGNAESLKSYDRGRWALRAAMRFRAGVHPGVLCRRQPPLVGRLPCRWLSL